MLVVGLNSVQPTRNSFAADEYATPGADDESFELPLWLTTNGLVTNWTAPALYRTRRPMIVSGSWIHVTRHALIAAPQATRVAPPVVELSTTGLPSGAPLPDTNRAPT